MSEAEVIRLTAVSRRADVAGLRRIANDAKITQLLGADRRCMRDAATEIENLRRLVTRLTGAAESLASEIADPGTEALVAIHCGKNFIYG